MIRLGAAVFGWQGCIKGAHTHSDDDFDYTVIIVVMKDVMMIIGWL